jgi:peptidoglycan hydrolase-like protein with peptidoglycan-binding domain
VTAEQAQPEAATARRRRHGGKIALGVGGLAVVAAAVAAAVGFGGFGGFGWFGGADEQPPRLADLPPATARVTRTTLTATETVDGTLGYGARTVLPARSGPGTLTWLPPPGRLIRRGEPAFRVDAAPVPLLYGSMPLFRTLRPGVVGADVTLLEENLAALGHGGFTVDDTYTDATADAVRAWQRDLGLAETGQVAVSQAVVAAGPIRVAELRRNPGDPANGPVLAYSGTVRAVTVDLDVAKQELVRRGIRATVELPDGRRVAGTVTAVGSVAKITPATGADPAATTIEVRVSVASQKALGRLDEAPVRVVLTAAQRENVLAAPVNALVALAEGGYGVQVVDGAATRYVAVETGMFANGQVEISGRGIRPGTLVGVPR